MSIQQLLTEFEDSTRVNILALSDVLNKFGRNIADEIEKLRPRAIAGDQADGQLQLDVALFDSAPILAVPKHAKFAPLVAIGHRFLAVADGMFVEVRRPWLHLIQRVAQIAAGEPRPPFGEIEPKVDLAFGKLGAALPMFREFIADATSKLPNEHAAWIVWDDQAKQLTYRALDINSSSPSHLDVVRPVLAEHESLAIDLHSHGAGEAFFSPRDNGDDAGEVKIAGVFGGLGAGGTPSLVFRLCALGLAIPLRVPVEAVFPAAQSKKAA
jgi:PRTRC genetic system protein A